MKGIMTGSKIFFPRERQDADYANVYLIETVIPIYNCELLLNSAIIRP